jgi:hypothetical protein
VTLSVRRTYAGRWSPRKEVMDIEKLLTEKYYAKKALRQLAVELAAVKSLYDDAADTLRSIQYDQTKVQISGTSDPTEKAAELRIKIWDMQLRDAERKAEIAMQTISKIDALVMAAGLDGREMEYIEIRYFEYGNVRGSVEKAQHRMGYEETTILEIKRSAFEKLKAVI